MNRYFPLLTFLVLLIPSLGYAGGCPSTGSLHYIQSLGHFDATDVVNVKWQSGVRIGFLPPQTYIAKKPVAFGSESNAQVMCIYEDSYGNEISLQPSNKATRWSLASLGDWKAMPGPESTVYVCKTTTCSFNKEN